MQLSGRPDCTEEPWLGNDSNRCVAWIAFRLLARLLQLVVMAPKSQDFDDLFSLQHLIDQAMLNIDTPRIGTGKIADELFEGGWRLEWISGNYGQQGFGLGL